MLVDVEDGCTCVTNIGKKEPCITFSNVTTAPLSIVTLTLSPALVPMYKQTPLFSVFGKATVEDFIESTFIASWAKTLTSFACLICFALPDLIALSRLAFDCFTFSFLNF